QWLTGKVRYVQLVRQDRLPAAMRDRWRLRDAHLDRRRKGNLLGARGGVRDEERAEQRRANCHDAEPARELPPRHSPVVVLHLHPSALYHVPLVKITGLRRAR